MADFLQVGQLPAPIKKARWVPVYLGNIKTSKSKSGSLGVVNSGARALLATALLVLGVGGTFYYLMTKG